MNLISWSSLFLTSSPLVIFDVGARVRLGLVSVEVASSAAVQNLSSLERRFQNYSLRNFAKLERGGGRR